MNTSRFAAGLVLAGLMLGSLSPALAQYKWRDAAGNVQYSDRPPPAGTPEKDILAQPRTAKRPAVAAPATPAAPASTEASASAPGNVKASDPELEARKKKEKEQQDAKRKAAEEALAKQKQENCQRARSYLRTLEDGIRISRTNDKGEREILDDKQRAEEVDRAKQGISSNCN